jgi:hypothetical protein
MTLVADRKSWSKKIQEPWYKSDTLGYFESENHEIDPHGLREDIRIPARSFKLPNTKSLAKQIMGVVIPSDLSNVAEAIERSKYILELLDDWDGEGSKKYKQETWDRAIQFLLRSTISAWHAKRIVPKTPRIYHGPEGSIDVYWETPGRVLLVNFPESKEDSATFYGSTETGSEVKGQFATKDEAPWLILWLA